MKRIRVRASASRSTVEAYNGRLAAANEDHEKRSPLRSRASSRSVQREPGLGATMRKTNTEVLVVIARRNGRGMVATTGCLEETQSAALLMCASDKMDYARSKHIDSFDNANPSDMFFDVFRDFCLATA